MTDKDQIAQLRAEMDEIKSLVNLRTEPKSLTIGVPDILNWSRIIAPQLLSLGVMPQTAATYAMTATRLDQQYPILPAPNVAQVEPNGNLSMAWAAGDRVLRLIIAGRFCYWRIFRHNGESVTETDHASATDLGQPLAPEVIAVLTSLCTVEVGEA